MLLVSCADRPGLSAATAEFITHHGGNIVHAEQHIERGAAPDEAVFFQRVVFDLLRPEIDAERFATSFEPLARHFGMDVELHDDGVEVPTAIMASRQAHCLYDLLARWRSGELPMDLRVVVSNHPDHAAFCEHMGLPYVHLPVTAENKADQEQRLLEVLVEHGVELVVLARYMQILSDAVIEAYPSRIINIHHSFLPAFMGANPYRQAHERGVKLIGATAHYATAELDEGPIIAQDTEHVTHRDDVARLTAMGRDLETVVLARAVRAHLEHRVAVHRHHTIVYT